LQLVVGIIAITCCMTQQLTSHLGHDEPHVWTVAEVGCNVCCNARLAATPAACNDRRVNHRISFNPDATLVLL
jgi:hypothetical protein